MKASIKNWFVINWLVLALIFIYLVKICLFNFFTGIAHDVSEMNLVANFGLSIFLFGIGFFFKKPRQRLIYLLVIDFLLSFIIVSNFIYFKYNGSFWSLQNLNFVWQAAVASNGIPSLLDFRIFYFILDLPLLILLMIFNKRLFSISLLKLKGKLFYAGAILLLAIAGYGGLFLKEYQANKDVLLLLRPNDKGSAFVGKAGILNYFIFSSADYLFRKKDLSQKEIDFVKNWRAKNPVIQSADNLFGAAQGKNVFLIQLESFQSFLINKTVNGKEITPNLNKIISESYYFNNYFYQTGSGNSSDAEFAMLNSLYPVSGVAAFSSYAQNNYYALPKLLDENGFQTIALHADDKNFWNRTQAFQSMGYQDFISGEQFAPARKISWCIEDKSFFEQSLEKIKSFKQPFFAHLISFTSHWPFQMPKDLKKMDLSGLNLSNIQKDYLWSVNYTDEALGEFVDGLKQSGFYDNSLILLSGDHESFITNKNDNNFANFLGYQSFDDYSFLETRRIPFVIHLPGQTQKEIISQPGSQLDFYPTLVNLLGLAQPSTILGRDLFNTKEYIEVKRDKPNDSQIDALLTNNFAFFPQQGDGKCLSLPEKQDLPLEMCQTVYQNEIDRIKVSTLVIESNRIDLLK